MSAWVVSKAHVDLIVNTLAKGTRDGVLKPRMVDLNVLGQQLVGECVHSVSYRYPQDDVANGDLPGPTDGYYLAPYKFTDPQYLPTAAELYQAIRCYNYQSCEDSRHWEKCAIKALLDSILAEIETNHEPARKYRADIERMNKERNYTNRRLWSELENAPWGFDTEEIAELRATWLANLASFAGMDSEIHPLILADWYDEKGLPEGKLLRLVA